MTEFEGEAFEVRTRLVAALGWTCCALGILGLLVLLTEPSLKHSLLIAALIAQGWYLILVARNVREIIINHRSIRFLPVDVELEFSEVVRMHVPSWADRWDNPPGLLRILQMETNTERFRWVPGAIMQGKYTCRISVNVRDDKRLLSTLRTYLPE
jgi:hypothetical protein